MKHILVAALGLGSGWVYCQTEDNRSIGFKNEATQQLQKDLEQVMANGQTLFGVANAHTISYTAQKHSHIAHSDVHDVVGAHPAFVESDFMWYTNAQFKKADMLALKSVHRRGGVAGFCWHLNGMQSGSFYASEADGSLVKQLLANPNRDANKALNWYLNLLDSLVIPAFNELGFPLTFRLFHEMNGDWFWWGSSNCTPQEYIQLFRLTVDYLRNAGVRNVLYVWSPDTYLKEEYYPGDGYVDVTGLDVYEPVVSEYHSPDTYSIEAHKLVKFALAHKKVAAITETGCRKRNGSFVYPIDHPDFWTRCVLNPVLEQDRVIGLAWIMSWYSSDWNRDTLGQFYTPYLGLENRFNGKGQEAIDDFIRFYRHPATRFDGGLPYAKP